MFLSELSKKIIEVINKSCFIEVSKITEILEEKKEIIVDEDEKKKWKKITSSDNKYLFFLETDIVINIENLIILRVENQDQQKYLFHSYKLEYQNLFQELYKQKKILIILTNEQTKSFIKKKKNDCSLAPILFSSEEEIFENIKKFFK